MEGTEGTQGTEGTRDARDGGDAGDVGDAGDAGDTEQRGHGTEGTQGTHPSRAAAGTVFALRRRACVSASGARPVRPEPRGDTCAASGRSCWSQNPTEALAPEFGNRPESNCVLGLVLLLR